jgi:hypothetical protein
MQIVETKGPLGEFDREALDAWRDNPVTKAFVASIEADLQMVKTMLVTNARSAASVDGKALEIAVRACGRDLLLLEHVLEVVNGS